MFNILCSNGTDGSQAPKKEEKVKTATSSGKPSKDVKKAKASTTGGKKKKAPVPLPQEKSN